MRYATLLAPVLLLAIAGCGTGGGGNTNNATPTPTTKVLGQRQLPGAMVSVERLAPVVAGTTCSFRVTITGSAVSAVSARLGSSYGQRDVIVATPVAGQSGRYDLAIPIPAVVPAGLRVWASITLADGSEVESGLDDFALN